MPTEKQQQEHGLYSFDGHKFTKLEVSDGKRIPVSDEGFEAVKAMRKELQRLLGVRPDLATVASAMLIYAADAQRRQEVIKEIAAYGRRIFKDL